MRHTACEHKLHVLPIPHAERASAQLDSLETAAVIKPHPLRYPYASLRHNTTVTALTRLTY
jgi:hypothetical protein